MAVGTGIMIVCLVLLVVVEIFFKDETRSDKKAYSVYDDPEFDGLDGISGVIGMNSEELDIEHDKSH
jgi:hypothetical protein